MASKGDEFDKELMETVIILLKSLRLLGQMGEGQNSASWDSGGGQEWGSTGNIRGGTGERRKAALATNKAQEAQIKEEKAEAYKASPTELCLVVTALIQFKAGWNQIGSFSPTVIFNQHSQVHAWQESS